MFREEMSDFSQPARPSRKAMPWVPIVLVALVALGVAHVVGLTKPVKTVAVQLGLPVPASWRTPGSRLIGDWESVDDPMFRRVCYAPLQEGNPGTGFYMADAGSGMSEVIFKITSEDRSGRHVETAEYLPRTQANFKVRYTIAPDGKSMTREYQGSSGFPVICQYRYVGPPTAEPPTVYMRE